jgi:hypothetical protein
MTHEYMKLCGDSVSVGIIELVDYGEGFIIF